MNPDKHLSQFLEKRKSDGSLRTITDKSALIDFCSNDYLGFARSEELKSEILTAFENHPEYGLGSTGSRLITGNSDLYEQVEAMVTKFHHADAGLIFNSGYDANLGLFASVPRSYSSKSLSPSSSES